MEDEGIIKKGTIFFIVFGIILIISFIVYFVFRKDNNFIENPNNPDLPIEPSIPSDKINENGIYGLFVNMEDANSYLEIKENGEFKFVLNVCEGYIKYNNDNSILSKNIEKNGDVYSISVTLVPKSTLDNNVVKFTGKLISATGVVEEYAGPYSCSPSYDYKRA